MPVSALPLRYKVLRLVSLPMSDGIAPLISSSAVGEELCNCRLVTLLPRDGSPDTS